MAEDSAAAQLEIRASWTPGLRPGRDRRGPRRRSARRGLGRAALHGGRAATGARRRGRHPEPPGTARLGGLGRVRPATSPTTTPSDAGPARSPRPERRCSLLRDGLPAITDTEAGLAEACAAIAAGTGPVAIDAERASGYRYSSRAYLIQLRREGSGTWLVDPIAFESLAPLAAGARRHRVDPARRHPGPALPDRGRAAAGLAVRHRARRTAARLPARRPRHAGRDGARRPDEEGALGGRLVDAGRCRSRGWSTPPSTSRCSSSCATRWPPQLVEAGKDEWARQEFEGLLAFEASRRAWTRGGVRRGCTGSAAVAAWARCARSGRPATSCAERRDVTPGRIIPDSAIVAAAQAMPTDRDALLAVKGFHGRGAERYASRWVAALRRGRGARRGRAAHPRPALRRPAAPRAPGPTATRSPPAGSAWPARRSASWPRSRGCRWRTCSPPTTCAGCCGPRPRPATRSRWPRAVDAGALASSAPGAWQIGLAGPVVTPRDPGGGPAAAAAGDAGRSYPTETPSDVAV